MPPDLSLILDQTSSIDLIDTTYIGRIRHCELLKRLLHNIRELGFYQDLVG